jgi:hypothetical protein
MRYVGKLLKGDDTFDYLDSTLLVRPDPPGAVDYMNQEGKSTGETVALDGHPTSYGGVSAIFVDDLFDTFQGTLVNASDPTHRVDAMLIHPRLPSPVPGGPGGGGSTAGGKRRRRPRPSPSKG